MRNADVARLFEDIADMLEVQGDSAFRYNAYREAARQIASWRAPIEELAAAGTLETIPGDEDRGVPGDGQARLLRAPR